MIPGVPSQINYGKTKCETFLLCNSCSVVQWDDCNGTKDPYILSRAGSSRTYSGDESVQQQFKMSYCNE